MQCQRIEEQAQKLAADIRAEASRSAEREVAAARKQLHAEAVRLAMELAEQRLKQQMVPEDQARMVDEYLRNDRGAIVKTNSDIKKIRQGLG